LGFFVWGRLGWDRVMAMVVPSRAGLVKA